MKLPHILADHGPETTARAAQLLRNYYTEILPTGRVRTGARFDHWSGGGDSPGVMNQLTADDMLAASFLSVDFSRRASIGLLESRRTDIAALLSRIPADVDLADMGKDEFNAVLGEGSPAWKLWDLLRGKKEGKPDEKWGIGPTKASKLMARKRPRLVPIWDSVVSKATHVESSLTQWADWYVVLRSEDRKLTKHLNRIQEEAHLPFLVSGLRVMDVVLWMQATHTGAPGHVLDAESED